MMKLAIFLLTVGCAHATTFVECGSDEATNKCIAKYNSDDAYNAAKACAYYTNVAACIPVGCCGSRSLSYVMPSQTALKNLGITTCNPVCGGAASDVVACDADYAYDLINSCVDRFRGVDIAKNPCDYYTKRVACLPAVCCAKTFAGTVTDTKTGLANLGLTTCNPVCDGPHQLSSGTRAFVSWMIVLPTTVSLVLFEVFIN
jgi:hypothetical protein